MLINLSVLLPQPTGISNYALNLLPYLDSLTPTLLCSRSISSFHCHQIPDNLTPAQGKSGHLRRLLWTQFTLPQLYRQFDSNLLFSPLPEAPLFSQCRYIVMVHDLIPLRFPNPKSFLTPYCRYIMPQVLKQSEHILCNSQATARDIIDFFDIKPGKVTPIPLACDNNHFRPLRLENSYHPPYFLYLGRHDPHKNVSRLITAFSQADLTLDYQLWLVGSSDQRYTPLLNKLVKELGLQQRVRFLDYVSFEELPSLYNRAIAFIFPSLWEGFGLPVLEAMACGTPTITANVGSLQEIAGEAALLVNPEDLAEISSAMKRIATNAQLRQQLQQLGLQRACEFSWEKTGHQTKEILAKFQ